MVKPPYSKNTISNDKSNKPPKANKPIKIFANGVCCRITLHPQRLHLAGKASVHTIFFNALI
jgi:hypothetical protein